MRRFARGANALSPGNELPGSHRQGWEVAAAKRELALTRG